MNRLLSLMIGIIFIIMTSNGYSQEPPIKVISLTENIYKLTVERGGYIVNILASVGEDGILLVDTGEKASAKDLKAAIDTLAGNKGDLPSIIINTHAHVDHTGGNAVFGRKPVVIAHEIVRKRLRSGSYLFDEFTEATLPDIVFKDTLTIYFNGDEIKLKLFSGSHDDNDIIVWFTKAKIAYIGDITNGTNFPSVEEVTGNVLNFPEVSRKVMTYLPEDITVISGHGEDGGRDQLKVFSDGISKTIEIIRAALAEGKDEAAMKEENILKDWESFEGSYVSKDEWINLVYMQLTEIPKESIYEPMYYALKNYGTDAAVNYYYELKKKHFNKYRFVENDLLFMADKLCKHAKYEEAAAFLQLDVSEYPDGMYTYYTYYLLGNTYKELGNRKLALKNYKKSYELKQTKTIEKILEEFESE